MPLTPMMQQYLDIKETYKDCILFFRLGDFYEMFFDDAIKASKVLEITLTGKNCGLEERAPMCGVPYHAADQYIAKLIDKGYKVAICEQTEDPALAKGLVKREVVQIVTPGTVLSQNLLIEKDNNYLVSIYYEEEIGLAYCDISTGEIGALSLSGQNSREKLFSELVKLSSKELLINIKENETEIINDIKIHTNAYITHLDENYYNEKAAEEKILRQFKVKSLHGLGLSESGHVVKALGALIAYLFKTHKQNISHIQRLKVTDLSSNMSLDKSTIKNLELTETLFEKKVDGSLLGVLDKTQTAMGSRKLKQWIKEPLNNLSYIKERLNAVEVLIENILMRNNLKELMKHVYDLERLTGRISSGNTNGKDLIALKHSIYQIPDIKRELKASDSSLLERLHEEMVDLTQLCLYIESAIEEDPPYTIKEGGVIRKGFSEELDSLKESISEGQLWIAGLEENERKRTGIKNLKVGFNKVFGYYIEVTKSYFDLIPEDYIRKQTLVNCERFITPELKEVEGTVLNAEAKINQMEYQLFQEIREHIKEYTSEIQRTASALAVLDVLLSFAEVSSRMGYVKPLVDDSDVIMIENGRHPVLEQKTKDGIFVPNNVYIDRDNSNLLLITGPNMSGKSTYMRQTALVVLMAQSGCFVPAEYAKIGIVDRIYTRIGASDNLAQGQSTFYVEMSELAYILNTATEKSLVILDEIGRGTSTYDGLSIAWSTVEYLCNSNRKIRTLFATHYHELTILEEKLKGVKNLNVDVQENHGNIVFLHKIVEGSTSKSYGIHVAKLAGVPSSVLENAEQKLMELESKGNDNEQNAYISNTQETHQLYMFEPLNELIIQRLKSLDLMNTTPSQAIAVLEELINVSKQKN